MNPFRQIAHVITRNGWCKGRFHDASGRRCLAGATPVLTRQLTIDIGHILEKTILEQFPERVDHRRFAWLHMDDHEREWDVAITFNDHELTTVDDIFLTLEKCAVQWDEVHA